MADTYHHVYRPKPFYLMLGSIFYLVFFTILILGITYTIYLSFFKPGSTAVKIKASTSEVTLNFIPSTIIAPSGTDFTTTITMNTNGKAVSAAEIHLTYDQTKLQGESIATSNFLPVVLSPGTIGTGEASIIVGAQPTSPQIGNGIVAIIKFKSLSSLPSHISYTNTTKVAAINETNNVAIKTNTASINEALSPTSTISTSPTLTPTQLRPSIINPSPQLSITNTPIAQSPTKSTQIPTPTPIITKYPTVVIQNLEVPVIISSNCNETDCNTIKTKLGKGCSTSDYFKCLYQLPTPLILPQPSITNIPLPHPIKLQFNNIPTVPLLNILLSQSPPPPLPSITSSLAKPSTGVSFINSLLNFFGFRK